MTFVSRLFGRIYQLLPVYLGIVAAAAAFVFLVSELSVVGPILVAKLTGVNFLDLATYAFGLLSMWAWGRNIAPSFFSPSESASLFSKKQARKADWASGAIAMQWGLIGLQKVFQNEISSTFLLAGSSIIFAGILALIYEIKKGYLIRSDRDNKL